MYVCMYIYIYIYIYIHITCRCRTSASGGRRSSPGGRSRSPHPPTRTYMRWHTGVCGQNIPPDERTGWKISFENTESGTGLQFLLLGRMAKAHVKGMFLLQTTVCVDTCRNQHNSAQAISISGHMRRQATSRYYTGVFEIKAHLTCGQCWRVSSRARARGRQREVWEGGRRQEPARPRSRFDEPNPCFSHGLTFTEHLPARAGVFVPSAFLC